MGNSESVTKQLHFPKLLSIGWSKRILSLCESALEGDSPISFDLSKVSFVAPFGLTVLSSTISKCLKTRSCYYTGPALKPVSDYLDRIGFSGMFLANVGGPQAKPTSLELKHLMGLDTVYIQHLIDLMDRELPM